MQVRLKFSDKKAIPNMYKNEPSPLEKIQKLEAQVASLTDSNQKLWKAVEALQAKSVLPTVVVPDTVMQ